MKKIQVVDFVRGFSILAVLAFHFNIAHVSYSPGYSFIYDRWRLFAANGAYGVQMFFVISGFLITRVIAESLGGLKTPDFRAFYSRRASRILPLLMLVSLIGAIFCFLPPWGASGFCLRNAEASFGAPFWISLTTFTFNWYRIFFAHPSHDFGLHWDILWSLSIEEQFYFFYPLVLLWAGRTKGLGKWLWVFVFLGPLTRAAGVVFFPDISYWNMNSLAEFDLISMGCLLHLTLQQVGKTLEKKQAVSWFLCLSGVFILLRAFLTVPTDLDYERRILGPSIVGAGTFLVLLGGIQIKWFESKGFTPFAAAGQWSYGGYLLHPLVLCVVWPLLKNLNEWEGFPLFVLAVLAVAWLSFHYFETPANRWVRAFLMNSPLVKK